MSAPADKVSFRSAKLPTLPNPGPRFYLRVRQGRVRDHRVRRLARVVKSNLRWLEPADEPAVRAWCLKEPPALIDKAAQLQKKWSTALGQIWQVGPNRLACGDCTDEAVVTALFAGANAPSVDRPALRHQLLREKQYLNRTDRGNRIQRAIENDSLSKVKELWANALSLVPGKKGVALYATVPSGPLVKVFMEGMELGGFAFKHFLVWVKQGFVIGMAGNLLL